MGQIASARRRQPEAAFPNFQAGRTRPGPAQGPLVQFAALPQAGEVAQARDQQMAANWRTAPGAALRMACANLAASICPCPVLPIEGDRLDFLNAISLVGITSTVLGAGMLTWSSPALATPAAVLLATGIGIGLTRPCFVSGYDRLRACLPHRDGAART